MREMFITLRQPCNNQRHRCDIAWLHVTNHLYHGFPSTYLAVCIYLYESTKKRILMAEMNNMA
jgi:hypothetical protein